MLFPDMRNLPNIKTDREAAARWAADLLAREDWEILYTETTGLGNKAQIVQVSIIDHEGKTLLDSLVEPTCVMEEAAQAVHGLSVERLAGAPSWPEIYPQLCEIVAGKTVIIYNDQFDLRIIWQTCEAWQLDEALMWNAEHTFAECAMLKYSAWVGEYNSRRDRPGKYKWQKLPGGDHSAVGDCLATLEIIRQMAASLKVEVVG